MEKYARQFVLDKIGVEGQNILKRKKILIVGLGGTGGLIAQLLTRAGVGTLYLSDKDYVTLSNIHRQTLFSENDIGKLKVDVAINYLKGLNSDVNILPIYESINSSNVEEYVKSVDLIIDGTDNFITRYIINDACVKHLKPWIYTAAIATYGSIMPIIPEKTACLRCLIKNIPTINDTCSTIGVLNSVPNAVASMAVSLAYKILLNDKIESKLYYFDGWEMKLEEIIIERQKTCPSCSLKNFEFLTEKYNKINNIC